MTTKADQKLPLRPEVECILCNTRYDRKETGKYRPLGAFENYCLCEACLHKDKYGEEARA